MQRNTSRVKTGTKILLLCFLVCVAAYLSTDIGGASRIEQKGTILAAPQLKVEVSIDKIKEGIPTDITVKVKDLSDNPVSNATVLLYISDVYTERPGRTISNGTTNAEGVVEFKGVVIDYASEDVYLYINAKYGGAYGYARIPTEELTFFDQLAEGLCIPATFISLIFGLILLGYGAFSVDRVGSKKLRIALAALGIILVSIAVWAILSIQTVGQALKPVVTIFSSIFGVILLITGSGFLLRSERKLNAAAGCFAAGIALLCVAGILIKESIEIMAPMAAPWAMPIFAGAGCILSIIGTARFLSTSKRTALVFLILGLVFLSLPPLMQSNPVSQNNYALLLLFFLALYGIVFVISAILKMTVDGKHVFISALIGLVLLGIASSLLHTTGWYGNYSFLLLSISVTGIVLTFTGVTWKKATVETQERYQSMASSGLYKEYSDQKASASNLKHVPGEKIFREWRANLTVLKDAELFMPDSLLKSFKYAGERKFYGGFFEAEEEVEYFREDKIVQKINTPYKLEEDPKPIPPNSFRNETQIYPYDQDEKECRTCSGTGKSSCPKCSGSGKEHCKSCGGKGYKQKAVQTGSAPRPRGPTQAVIYTKVYKLRDADGNVRSEIKVPHTQTIGGGYTGMRIDPFKIEKYTCPECNGSGLSNAPCERCNGTGQLTCQECNGYGKLRVIKRKIWEYKHEKEYGTATPERCTAVPSNKELLTVNEQEFDNINSLTFLDEDKNANPPTIKEILRKLHADYVKWLGREKGRVVLNSHKAYIFPITECIVEYPGEKGKKKFSIWGAGNLRNWIIRAETTPIRKTHKFLLRHIMFSMILLSEVIAAVILHKLLIFS